MLDFIVLVRRRLNIHFQRFRPHLSRTGWAASDAIVGPILSVVVSPVLLHTLGNQGFGLWALSLAIAGFGGMASLGIGIATTKIVSEKIAAGQHTEAVVTTRAALSIALTGAFFLFLFSALFSNTLATAVFPLMGSTYEVSRVLVLGLALLALQEIEGVFAGALRGAQRFDVCAGVDLSFRAVWMIAVIVTAWITRDAASTVLCAALVTAVKICIKSWAARKVLNGPCFLPSRCKSSVIQLLHLGKWLWVQGLGGVLFSVLDRIIVGAIFGASDLARYSICIQLAQLVHGVQANALQPILPWITSRAALVRSGATSSPLKIAILGGIGCVIFPVILIIFAEVILELWIGTEFSANNANICRLLIAGYGLLAFNIPVHFMLLGLGSVKFLALTNLIAGIASTSASFFLTPFGMEYFALGKLCFAPLTFLNFLMLKQHIAESASSYIRSMGQRTDSKVE